MDVISKAIKNNHAPGGTHYRVLKDIYGNTGKMEIGLAICKAFVNAQGGEISAPNEDLGKGIDQGHIRSPLY